MDLLFSKPSGELVFDLINLANPGLPKIINAQNCIVEAVTQVQPSDKTNNRNTQARLRGIQGSGFTDSVILYYDRINVANLIITYGSNGAPSNQFVSYTAANVHQALAVIFETYGVNFGTMDVASTGIAGANTARYTASFSLSCQPTSPAYYGSTPMRCYRGLPVLDTSITKNVLDVMEHPISPNQGQQCVDMLTFGIDFTAYKNLLNVTSAGLPNWAGLRNVLDQLGVPHYSGPLNSNTVSDVATTGKETANKMYDRVVIHTGIDEAGAKGIAYYHYNN